MDESTRTQFYATKVANDHRGDIHHAGAFKYIQHRLSRGSRGLSIIGRTLNGVRLVHVVDIRRAMVTCIGKTRARCSSECTAFTVVGDAADETNKPRALYLYLMFSRAVMPRTLVFCVH